MDENKMKDKNYDELLKTVMNLVVEIEKYEKKNPFGPLNYKRSEKSVRNYGLGDFLPILEGKQTGISDIREIGILFRKVEDWADVYQILIRDNVRDHLPLNLLKELVHIAVEVKRSQEEYSKIFNH